MLLQWSSYIWCICLFLGHLGFFSPPHLEGITLNIPPISSCEKDREPSQFLKRRKKQTYQDHDKYSEARGSPVSDKMCVFFFSSFCWKWKLFCFLRESDCSVYWQAVPCEGTGYPLLKRFFPYKVRQYFSSHLESWPEYKVDEVTLFLKLQKRLHAKVYPQIRQHTFRKHGAVFIWSTAAV